MLEEKKLIGNSVNEALISNVQLRNSIPTESMKSKIKNGESQLTSEKKEYQIPVQLTMKLEEEKLDRTKYIRS